MKQLSFDRFFILEMANNHMGDVDHGIKILRSFREVTLKYDFRFAFKFQYRCLKSFVHPDFVKRTDIKLIKRFTETILNDDEYKILKDEATRLGFFTVCTPFDESSVDLIAKHQYDAIKVPSCYFNDWPLLEKIAAVDLPIIASTGGAKFEDIDKVVAFFNHRDKKLGLMHCVGEYPTVDEHLQLNQIDLMQKRYTNIPVGFSTHETPDNVNSIKIAIAKGAKLFEKHVAVPTEKYAINAYSVTPEKLDLWLQAAKSAYTMCGVENERHQLSLKECSDLRALHRGAYAKLAIKPGDKLTADNVFFAMPNVDCQLVANEFSKYARFVAKEQVAENAPIMHTGLSMTDLRHGVMTIMDKVSALLKSRKVAIPNRVDVEISHHVGIERFNECGAVIINIVNRDYCKKLLVMFAGQKYPSHFHKRKDETIHVLHGELILNSNTDAKRIREGDFIIVEQNFSHSFEAATDLIFEEISTTYYKGDSYYSEDIYTDENRKTELTYWV